MSIPNIIKFAQIEKMLHKEIFTLSNKLIYKS